MSKSAFSIVPCSNWNDFRARSLEVLRGSIAGDLSLSSYVFRGQSCSSWGIESSLDRKYKALTESRKEEIYKNTVNNFASAVRMYGDIGGRISRKFDNIDNVEFNDKAALAQHFGIPTKLIDWTESIFVAAFFAISASELCDSGNVSVFALNKSAPRIIGDRCSFIENVYEGNNRQLWQAGKFIINETKYINFIELFREENEFISGEDISSSGPLLYRFDFPVAEIHSAKSELEMMRINHMTLFPGIEGIAMWMRDGGAVFS